MAQCGTSQTSKETINNIYIYISNYLYYISYTYELYDVQTFNIGSAK